MFFLVYLTVQEVFLNKSVPRKEIYHYVLRLQYFTERILGEIMGERGGGSLENGLCA